jgi:TctA family transporter
MMVDQFAAILGTTIGESIFLTIFGMAFVSLRRKPSDPPIPSYSEGGLQLFLLAWGVTFVCSLIVEIVLVSLGVPDSDSIVSVGRFLIPSICAFYFVKGRLAARKI